MVRKGPTRDPDDRYVNRAIYEAKHGLLPEWHPTFRDLTPAE